MQRQQPRRDLGDGGREAACVARYLVCLFFASGISKTGKIRFADIGQISSGSRYLPDMYLPRVIIKRWQCSRVIRSISRVPNLRDARAQKEAASRVARLFLEINGRELYHLCRQMASLTSSYER